MPRLYPEKYGADRAFLELWEPGATQTPPMTEQQGGCSKPKWSFSPGGVDTGKGQSVGAGKGCSREEMVFLE